MEYLNKSIYLKRPSFFELSLTEELLGDEKTMSFNNSWGGTVSFPKEKWGTFFKTYMDNDENEYFHIYNLDHIFVGEISTRYDNHFQSYVLNIKVKYDFRGNNHGSDALEVFLDYMFNEKRIEKIVDNVALDNEDSVRLLSKYGFVETFRTDEYSMLELTKKDYLGL